MSTGNALARHWEAAYADGDTTCSWYQSQSRMSLRMLASAAVSPTEAVRTHHSRGRHPAVHLGGVPPPIGRPVVEWPRRRSPAPSSPDPPPLDHCRVRCQPTGMLRLYEARQMA